MPIFHAIVLGLVQGLTEFLPVSSSGHLLLVPWLMGWNDFADVSVEKAFDVALHLGTLIAVMGYFRHDLVTYIRDGLRMVLQRQRPSTPEVAWHGCWLWPVFPLHYSVQSLETGWMKTWVSQSSLVFR